MGWVMMSERELGRIEVLSRVVDGTMTSVAAANVLAVTPRQIVRLLKRFREEGAAALRHGLRGRPSNRRANEVAREEILRLVREHYADFGPTLAAEKLAERHSLTVSRETLRRWMAEAGLWLSPAAPHVSSTAAAAGTTGQVDPDRRIGSPLVRRPRASLHAPRVH